MKKPHDISEQMRVMDAMLQHQPAAEKLTAIATEIQLCIADGEIFIAESIEDYFCYAVAYLQEQGAVRVGGSQGLETPDGTPCLSDSYSLMDDSIVQIAYRI